MLQLTFGRADSTASVTACHFISLLPLVAGVGRLRRGLRKTSGVSKEVMYDIYRIDAS